MDLTQENLVGLERDGWSGVAAARMDTRVTHQRIAGSARRQLGWHGQYGRAVRAAPPSSHRPSASDQRNEPDYQEHKEQNLGNSNGCPGNASKAENTGYQRDDQKNQRVMQHYVLLAQYKGIRTTIVMFETN